jgi:UDP-N-acetylglucosamine 3-dehydrogenase
VNRFRSLTRQEIAGHNVYDYRSHSFDLCNYFNSEVKETWVLAQIDYRGEVIFFGARNENHAVVQ